MRTDILLLLYRNSFCDTCQHFGRSSLGRLVDILPCGADFGPVLQLDGYSITGNRKDISNLALPRLQVADSNNQIPNFQCIFLPIFLGISIQKNLTTKWCKCIFHSGHFITPKENSPACAGDSNHTTFLWC